MAANLVNRDLGREVEIDGRPFLDVAARRAGHVLYGPYAGLNAGVYRVEFELARRPGRTASDGPCVILDVVAITIGDGAQIGPAVQIYAADHPRDPETRRAGLEFGRPVRIGANAWIGGGAIILPGVTVGDDAVVGAGSVVTRDVPDSATVAGNPARVR